MFAQQVAVLRYVPVVEVGYAKVEQNIEKEREVDNGKIETIVGSTHGVLHRAVNAKYPERFY